jgi:hypothetical protein
VDWYYAREGQRQGPMPEARLRELIATGEVRAGDLIWRPGFESWRPAGEVPEIFPAPPASTDAPPAVGTGPALSMRWVPAYSVIMAVIGGLQILSALAQLGGRHGRMPLGMTVLLFQWIPAVLSIAVAWSLTQRRRWAWQVNFWLYLFAPLVLGGLIFVAVTIAFVFVESKWHAMGIGIAPAVMLFAFALGLFALWPALNLVYFKKRRHLFTA